MSSKVFLSIKHRYKGYSVVYDARDYQSDAYHAYMKHDTMTEEIFTFFGKQYGQEDDIILTMKPFDSSGFKGCYDSFCIMIDKHGQEYLLSDQEHIIKGFTGYMNRVWYATC